MAFSPDLTQEEKVAHYRSVAERYIAAVNGKDLDAILAVFADDAQVHDPVGKRTFSGKQALREFYSDVITRAHLEVVGPIRGSYSNCVAAPVVARVPGTEINVITVTEFDDAGLVQSYSAYWGPLDVRTV